MSIICDVNLRLGATPGELRALGTALWGWCQRATGGADVYQYLDSQALADLIAGRLPTSGQSRWPAEWSVHFRFRDEVSQDCRATIDSLRRALPSEGIEDVLVDGQSWHRTN